MNDSARKAFALRLDPSLHAALERSAATDLRSVNAQVETVLVGQPGLTLVLEASGAPLAAE